MLSSVPEETAFQRHGDGNVVRQVGIVEPLGVADPFAGGRRRLQPGAGVVTSRGDAHYAAGSRGVDRDRGAQFRDDQERAAAEARLLGPERRAVGL
jgi:hypothetical protein